MNKQDRPVITLAADPSHFAFSELMSAEAEASLEKYGWTLRIPPADSGKEGIAGFMKNSDAIITTWGAPKIDQAILDANPDLKIVGHAAGSVADFVSQELYDAGIKVTTANDLMALAVAEWCLAMTMNGLRRFPEYSSINGKTELRWDKNGLPRSVRGAKIGIWGYGAIASRFVKILKPLEPGNILVSSSYLTEERAAIDGVTKVSFNEMFAESDVVLLLTSLKQSTIGRVGAEQLSLMRDNSVLINCGRGKLTDEQALYDELRKGRISAMLDVYHKEPLPEDSPLRSMSNVFLTPHNAGRPSRGGYVSLILDEFDRFFNGQPLLHEVSRERALTMTSKL